VKIPFDFTQHLLNSVARLFYAKPFLNLFNFFDTQFFNPIIK